MGRIAKEFGVALVCAAVGAAALSAQGPNGTDPRPFYVIAHNPNTLETAELALVSGANALEPDVNVLPPGSIGFDPPGSFATSPDPPGLVMYHDDGPLTARVPLTLEQYLEGLHALAKKYPHFAAMMLDIKPNAAKRENGPTILAAIRQHLNYDGVNLSVILNVGSLHPDSDVFTDILPLLGEREGVQVDTLSDPTQLVAALGADCNFGLAGAPGCNIAYGDATLAAGTDVPRAIDWGSFLKASWGIPRWVYAGTIISGPMMDFFMDAGADGIIPDHLPLAPPVQGLALAEFDPASMAWTQDLFSKIGQHPQLKYATRNDNPFMPNVQAYGLQTRTMAVQYGGTDSPLTFTLEGCRGTSEVTFHTGFAPNAFETDRMEQGGTDHVTIPSLNLGKLTALHIWNQGGAANYPDWALQDVAVSSAVYLGSDFQGTVEYTATLNDFIYAGDTKSLKLTPNFQEPAPTIECPAPITVNNAPGKCSAVVSFAPKVDGMCPDVTAVSTPPAGSAFAVGTTSVSSQTASPSFPNVSSTCSFTVTVKDVEPPLVVCPGPIDVNATGPSGAIATFAATAGDNCSATVTSAPPSGSLFAIGTTPVSSTAQDPSGNQSSCTFTVHVKGAAEQTSDLIAQVTGMSIKASTKNALVVKLNSALTKLQSGGSMPGACGALSDFISLASAQRGKDIPMATADALIAAAGQIKAVIGC